MVQVVLSLTELETLAGTVVALFESNNVLRPGVKRSGLRGAIVQTFLGELPAPEAAIQTKGQPASKLPTCPKCDVRMQPMTMSKATCPRCGMMAER